MLTRCFSIDNVCTMEKTVLPKNDFCSALNKEIEISGFTFLNFVLFCRVSSSLCAITRAFFFLLILCPITADKAMVFPNPVTATPKAFLCFFNTSTLFLTNFFCLCLNMITLEALSHPPCVTSKNAHKKSHHNKHYQILFSELYHSISPQ